MATNPYTSIKNSIIAALKKQRDAQASKLKNDYTATVNNTNNQYDNNAKQAYITYRQSQKALPEQLSSLGATGGRSESGNIKLQTAYGTNLSNNEAGRGTALATAKGAYDTNLNENTQNYLSKWSNAMADYGAREAAWREEQQRIAREAAERAAASRYSSYSSGGYSSGSSGSGWGDTSGSTSGSTSDGYNLYSAIGPAATVAAMKAVGNSSTKKKKTSKKKKPSEASMLHRMSGLK